MAEETAKVEKTKQGFNIGDMAKQGLGTGIVVTLVFLIGRFTDPLVEDLRQQRQSVDELEEAVHAQSVRSTGLEGKVDSKFATLEGKVDNLNAKFDWFIQQKGK